MFAVVRTGGKQYRVAAGDKIVVEKLAGEAGDTVTLGDVLLAGEGGELKSTDGLTVSAEIIAQAKGDKVIVFKKRRRHNYRRKRGHRQQHTILRIVAIGDQKAAPKKAAAKKAEGRPKPRRRRPRPPPKAEARRERRGRHAGQGRSRRSRSRPSQGRSAEAPPRPRPTASEKADADDAEEEGFDKEAGR